MLKRLETSLDIVAQSFMVFSDFMGAFSSVGRAPALQAGGRRFESDMVHFNEFLDMVGKEKWMRK